MFPNFLEKDLINYILRYANLDHKQKQLKGNIVSIKNKIKFDIISRNSSKIQNLLISNGRNIYGIDQNIMAFNTINSPNVNFDTDFNSFKENFLTKDGYLNYDSSKNVAYSSKTISSIDTHENMQSSVGFPKDFTLKGYDHRKPRPTSQSGVLYQAILENKNMTLK